MTLRSGSGEEGGKELVASIFPVTVQRHQAPNVRATRGGPESLERAGEMPQALRVAR
jgi:hypothetical protein